MAESGGDDQVSSDYPTTVGCGKRTERRGWVHNQRSNPMSEEMWGFSVIPNPWNPNPNPVNPLWWQLQQAIQARSNQTPNPTGFPRPF